MSAKHEIRKWDFIDSSRMIMHTFFEPRFLRTVSLLSNALMLNSPSERTATVALFNRTCQDFAHQFCHSTLQTPNFPEPRQIPTWSSLIRMPAPTNTLIVEGTLEELADELAVYIDGLRKDAEPIQPEVSKLLQDGKQEDALKKLVGSSSVLNSAPEKGIKARLRWSKGKANLGLEIIAAYNLLIHIVRQSQNPDMYLNRICQHLSAPIASSPTNGLGLQLEVLCTVFNTVSPTDESRFHILMAILQVIRSNSSFEVLKPQLKNLDSWLALWESDEEDSRRLFLTIADAATEAGEADLSYQYLVRALQTVTSDESSSPQAQQLSLRALKVALTHPSHFDFQDLTALDSIQALRRSDPTHFELLELFTSETLDDFNDFKEQHSGWLGEQGLDEAALDRKMRLLTLCSLAASAHQTRSLKYSEIAKGLQIPDPDVEMWVIDVIRAGLVEGKLSQLNQTFLIHRATYRVFGENQWREVDARLNMWKNSLRGVLEVIRQQKAEFALAKEQELREMEAKVNGTSGGDRGGGYRNRQPRQVEVDGE